MCRRQHFFVHWSGWPGISLWGYAKNFCFYFNKTQFLFFGEPFGGFLFKNCKTFFRNKKMSGRAPVFSPIGGRKTVPNWKGSKSDREKNKFFYIDSKLVNICGVDVRTVPSRANRVNIVIFLLFTQTRGNQAKIPLAKPRNFLETQPPWSAT